MMGVTHATSETWQGLAIFNSIQQPFGNVQVMQGSPFELDTELKTELAS